MHGNSYGALRTLVDEAALSSALTFAILTIPATEILFRYLRTKGREREFLALYLSIEDEELLRKRLTARGDREADIAVRLVECRNWEALRRASTVPFKVVDSRQPREDIIREAGDLVAQALQTSATPPPRV